MNDNVELSTLNLRYESYRLRDNASEARVLASIAERGIEEPLEGVDTADDRFLLNGFKRRRCAKKLGIHHGPYVSLAEEEASGIVTLMRAAPNKSLQILEQAKFVVELLTIHGMSVGDVADAHAVNGQEFDHEFRLLEDLQALVGRRTHQSHDPRCFFLRQRYIGAVMNTQFLGATASLEAVEKEPVIGRVDTFERFFDASLGNRRQDARFAGVVTQPVAFVPQVQGG